MATNELTWEGIRHGVHEICKKRGWHHGVPIMSATDPTRRVILARGCPLSDKHGHDVPVEIGGIDNGPRLHVCRDSDIDETQSGPYLVNVWVPKQSTVGVIRERGKYKAEKVDSSRERFDMLIKSVLCQAGAVEAVAELNAVVALRGKVNQNQWESYILSGCFPETSPRSHVTYLLRKGLPTIAMRCRPNPDGPGEIRTFLAALCSHPLGWFESTHVGCYPPTDEVIANILAIRADEHAFWKKSKQHTMDDPLSAI